MAIYGQTNTQASIMQIRDYNPSQASAFLALYRACLAHYGIPAATVEEENRVVSLLDAGRHMSCLVAYEEDTPLGFATWVLTFPAGASLALYMKEIFVLDTARGKGVGRAILSALLERAEAEGCTRMDWQTDGNNLASQNFYDRLGAPKKARKSLTEFSEMSSRHIAKRSPVRLQSNVSFCYWLSRAECSSAW